MYYYKSKDGKRYGTSHTEIIEDDELMPITEDEYYEKVGRPYEPPVLTKEQRQKIDRVYFLKSSLSDTDYQAIKYAEGEITEEDYEPIKLQRREWRAEINRLEEELDNELETYSH